MQPRIEIERDSKGRIKQETPYVDGKKHGTEKQCHNDGMLWDEVNFVHGKRHGSEKWWDFFKWRFGIWRLDERQIQIHSKKEPGKNKPLFSKSQWKTICNQQG